MPKLIDLTGKSFGRLVVLHRSGYDNTGRILWMCECDCGTMVIIRGCDLRSVNSQSCGCLRTEKIRARLTRHGHAKRKKKSRIYNTWIDMIKRCTNRNNIRYERYGGRGITVCERWINSFENFLEDMGEPPTNKHMIDRINNDKGYYYGNCRWATVIESNRNTSQNHLLTHEGVTKCAVE